LPLSAFDGCLLYNFELIQIEVPFQFFFGELQIIDFNLVFEFSNPIVDIVAPGVADEKVVGHWISFIKAMNLKNIG
jgi:hypothetical protein